MKSKKRTKLNISACYEIQVYYKRPLFDETKKVISSETAEAMFRAFLDKNRIDFKEFFLAMLLTHANQVIGISEVSVGSTHATSVNVKEIFQLALLTNASAIIVAHNHPSGNLNASKADINITQKIKKASDIMDISLLDHLIISTEGFISMAENNQL